MAKKKKKQHEVGLSTTMMVDVLFILLVFFIMVSQFKKNKARIKTPKLKTPSTKKQSIKTKKIALDIDKKNQVFLDGKKVKMDDLFAHLEALKSKIPQGVRPVIMITGDSQSKLESFTTVLGILSQAKLAKYAQLETDKDERKN